MSNNQERRYAVRPYGQIFKNGVDGFRQGAQKEGFKLFAEQPIPLLETIYGVYMLPSPETRDRLEERVFSALRKLEEEFGLEYHMAGREYPAHITLQECFLPKGMEIETAAKLSARMATVQDLEDLSGLSIPLNLAIPDKGNVLVVSHPITIPAIIPEIRGVISEQYAQEDSSSRPISIVHSTVARIHKDNAFLTLQERLSYVRQVTLLSQSLHREPLDFRVQTLFINTSAKLVSQIKPDQSNI